MDNGSSNTPILPLETRSSATAAYAATVSPATSAIGSTPTLGLDKVFCLRASRSRTVAGLAGPLLLGLGSGISVSAGFGPLGFSVLLDGLHASLGAPLWLSQLLLTVVFYAIAWRWARIPLGMGTLPSLLLIGPAISLGATLTPVSLPLAGHALAFASGLTLFALGISLAAAAAFGPDGVTALSLAAEKRLRVTVARANFVWNSLAIVIGISLGGNAGAATVIGLITVPLLIQQFLPWLRGGLVRP